jgi:hypothetical protein
VAPELVQRVVLAAAAAVICCWRRRRSSSSACNASLTRWNTSASTTASARVSAAVLNPENRSQATTVASGACSASSSAADALPRPWATATTSEVSRHTSAVTNCRRRFVSRPVTITVSSIPTLVGRTAASWSAGAVTARIASGPSATPAGAKTSELECRGWDRSRRGGFRSPGPNV